MSDPVPTPDAKPDAPLLPAFLDLRDRPVLVVGGGAVARRKIAATDEPDTNRAVAKAGQARRLWANVVDDAPLCSFQVPVRIERGPLPIAISGGGGAPMLALLVEHRLGAAPIDGRPEIVSTDISAQPPSHALAEGA